MGRSVGTPESLSTRDRLANPRPVQQRQVVDNQRLAYLSEQVVNWCPALGTALANEEVIDGKSERGGHPVVRKPLKQWMFRITSFADRLANDLDTLDWPHSMSSAARMDRAFRVRPSASMWMATPTRRSRCSPPGPTRSSGQRSWSSPPNTLSCSGPTIPEVQACCEAAANRSERERQADDQDKTGVALGLRGIHPVSGALVPIWVADYVLMGYGADAIMAVPGHDDRDHAFATKFGIEITTVVARMAQSPKVALPNTVLPSTAAPRP